MGLLRTYERWLHGRWPAGTVEALPVSDDQGRTNVDGIFVVGDLTGVPLLKFALDTGAAAVQTIVAESQFQSREHDPGVLDVVIVGAGVSGVSAATEADEQGLQYALYEGALAETLGDTLRHKMPHGPISNRLNMVGQVVLACAFILMTLRVIGWLQPGGMIDQEFSSWVQGDSVWTYKWIVDVMLGGILGVGLYFHFSGRTWCRFACPLAALMHVYTRLFSRFRIFAEKAKCISCGQCTRICHQGIDVMSFANKGQPMEDPQCVRCSACVHTCPTGVLQFGRIDSHGQMVPDRLIASPVRRREVPTARRLPIIS